MPKKLGLLFAWAFLTPIVLGASLFFLYSDSTRINRALAYATTLVAESSKPNTVEGQVLGVEISDMRPLLISIVLKKTVLEPYSNFIVQTADKYGIDYRLIPSIAMKESGGGNKAPKGTYNAWGFENGKTQFDSWENAIDVVGKTLKTRYIDKGLTTPDQIMPIYAPPAVAAGGGWAKDVNYFSDKIDNAAK